jgi:hypothetical protein
MDLIEEQDHEYDLEERMTWNISKAKEVALATQNHQCIQWDRKHQEMEDYQIGDKVLLRSDGLLLAKFRKFPRHFSKMVRTIPGGRKPGVTEFHPKTPSHDEPSAPGLPWEYLKTLQRIRPP